MTHLADACALLAFFGTGARAMTGAGRAAMLGFPSISPVTVWEIAAKARAGKLPPPPIVRGSFTRYLEVRGFHLLNLEAQDAEVAATLPPIHKDPMDRMLIATARRAGLCIITCDAVFGEYGVNTVW